MVDVVSQTVGEGYDGDTLIGERNMAVGWALSPRDARGNSDQFGEVLSGFRERPIDIPGDFPTWGGVIKLGDFGVWSVGFAQIGTVVTAAVEPGDDESFVKAAVPLMVEPLLKNELPGDWLTRRYNRPWGPGWSPTGNFTHKVLDGVSQPRFGQSDEKKTSDARWAEVAPSVMQASFPYKTFRDDVTAEYSLQLGACYDLTRAEKFFADYPMTLAQDSGAAITPLGGPIVKDKVFFFGAYEELPDGGRKDSLGMFVQRKHFVFDMRFNVMTKRSAADVADAFRRDGYRDYIDATALLGTQQSDTLDRGVPNVYRRESNIFTGLFPRNPTDSTRIFNPPGVVLYPSDYGRLGRNLAPRIIQSSSYYYLGAGEFPSNSRGLTGMLRRAGLVDVVCLRVGTLNGAGDLIDLSASACGYSLNPENAFGVFRATRDFVLPYQEHELPAPRGFANYPYYGAILTVAAFGANFPPQSTVAIAAVGNGVFAIGFPGVNPAFVGEGMNVMRDRLLTGEDPGYGFGRQVVIADGEFWNPEMTSFYYPRLYGVDQPIHGMTDEDKALLARRNEGQQTVFQSRFAYNTGRNDAAAGMDTQLRLFDSVDLAATYFNIWGVKFEQDLGFPALRIGARPIPKSDQSQIFLTSRQRPDGVWDDAVAAVNQVGPVVAVQRFGVLTRSRRPTCGTRSWATAGNSWRRARGGSRPSRSGW